jgi:endonuclease YncB( thermonuclease family)
MRLTGFRYPIFCALLASLIWAPMLPAASKLISYANVRTDATLLVGSRVVRLYGIHVPASGRTCRANLRPVKCGSNAVLALEFKIRGFVRCDPIARHADRSITALCRNRGVDLSAYLIERGWAVALPDGPFEYQVLERIARERRMGVWGMHGVAIAPSPTTR